ncbi:MAG: HD-GYP domain-containing protein [Peptococcaceae bacterium]|nr:HD-GYP domain-containing protein [Peptococcaceae bacterium]
MYHHKLFQKESSRSQIINSLMAALAERDYITQGHARRLLDKCVKVGRRKNLSPGMLTALALLSQVHDLGKVGIPDSILFKPAPLTEEEWKIMRQHPEKGYRIAVVSPDLSEIADLILKHHERWDGKGYPLGLRGEDIPVECRILSVVDSYDAMISERPYSKPKSKEEALQELIRCAGTQFDPEIVRLFTEVLEEEGNEPTI